MKITKVVLMLIVGMFVSVGVLAFEAPAVDKITSSHSIYVAPSLDAAPDWDVRSSTVTGEHASNESQATLINRPSNDGGKVEVGWRISTHP